MVRIRGRQVKVPNLLSPPQPVRKRKLGDNIAIDSNISRVPSATANGGNVFIRSSKRSRTAHLPYQSPESLEALITVAGRRKKAAENQETPKSKVKSLVTRTPKKLEKPVKRLQKQASNVKQSTPKQAVRRKLLATPEPAKPTAKAVTTLTKTKKKVVKAKKALIKPAKQKVAASPSTGVRKRKSAKEQPDKNKPVEDKEGKRPKLKRKKGKLNPKPDLKNYEKDPTFESRLEIPFVSTLAHSRLLIRAVLLKDLKLLKKLIHEETKKIYTLCMPRSAFVNENVLNYIIKTENKEAFNLLYDVPLKIKENFGPSPSLLISPEHTGYGSHRMFGHAMRQVSVGRGGKEGNDAFLYDSSAYNYPLTPSYRNESIKIALQTGASQSFIDFLMEKQQLQDWDYTEIHLPLRKGHHALVGKAITKAFERGGYGFNFLHGEVLTKTTSSSLTPFKPVSVVKKCTYDPRFTPLHCAAINPNVEIITTLLRSMPDYNLADGQGWTVGHYAAVCSSPEPLKYLLQFGISVHTVTSTKRNGDGYTFLHAAVAAGRTHNVKVILEHDKSTAKDNNVPVDDDAEEGSRKPQKGLLQNDLLYKLTTQGQNALHLACELGHLEIVKLLLEAETDMDRPTPAKYGKVTPLMIACQYGHLDIVKAIVESNAKLEAKDKRGRTAVAHAAMNGHTHVLSFLLRLGVNHMALDSSGNSLLHYATAYGWYFATMLLLEAGCPPNQPNHWKMTPVAISFMKGHTGLMEILMKQEQVDVNASIDDSSGRTLLLETCFRSNDLGKLQFLVENLKADMKCEDFNGKNALHYMAEKTFHEYRPDSMKKLKSFEECVAFLVQEGCDPYKKNQEGRSSILLAAQQKNFYFISKLLQMSIKIPFEQDDFHYTFLHYLVMYCMESDANFGVYKKCVTGTAGFTALSEMAKSFNKGGLTPLHLLLSTHGTISDTEKKSKFLQMVETFLGKLGSNINAVLKDKSERTALHLAISTNNALEILNILLKYKPNLDPLDKVGQTPLVTSILNGSQSVADKLIAAGANAKLKIESEHGVGLMLFAAMKETKSFFLIPKLLSKGTDPHEIHPKTKNSLLHYIARKPALPHAPEAVNALLTEGVNPNLVNCDGRTPLHLAVNARGSETDVFYDIEDALISAGANLTTKDQRGRIPLHYAFVKIGDPTATSFFDPIELVSSLVTAMKNSGAEAEIHSPDVFGCTPLHYAAFRGATICSSYLIQALPRGEIDRCDNNGNTPFGLAVRNSHEGCSLNFYQQEADFLRIINNNIQLQEVRMETETAMQRKPPASEPWEWNHLVKIKEQDKKYNEEQARYPILEQVVKLNWQGLLYLMIGQLQRTGIGFSTGIATALKTRRYKLALKLALRVKSKKELTLEAGTLFHTVAKYYSSVEEDLVQKICELFWKNGLDSSALDEFGSQPVIYALINKNTRLIDILCTNINDSMKHLATIKPDLFGRTAFTALFWNAVLETPLQPPIEAWANQLVAAGANPNHLCEYPISLSPCPGIRFTRNLTNIIPSNGPRYPPLTIAVITKSYRTVKWLLNIKSGPIKVDVNTQDSEGRTALMHALRLNDAKMVKLLLDPLFYDYNTDLDGSKAIRIKSINVDSTLQDKNGKTLLDYLLFSPGDKYYYKNIHQTVKCLQQIGAFNITTAMSQAVQHGRADIVEIFTKYGLIAAPKGPRVQPHYLDFAPEYSQDIVLTPIQDFNAAAEKMADKIMEKAREKLRKEGGDEEMKLKPDPLCGIEEGHGEVMIDDKQNIPFDCLMTKVDLSYGIHGLYNFYKMQLVKQTKGKDLILLFTQWGRVGEQGQHQKTPFGTSEDAIKEFTKIFKAKSGNAWEDVQNFNPIPTKYRLVKKDLRILKHSSQVNVDFEEVEKAGKNISSVTPGSILHLLRNLCLVHRSAGSTYQSNRYYHRFNSSPDYCNLPLLPIEVLNRGESILKEIAELIVLKQKMGEDKVKYPEKDQIEVVTKIATLSETFYALIPVYGYSTEKLEPIFNEDDLRQKLQAIGNLVHLELAKKMLLAAQYNSTLNSQNPYEYVYRCLGPNIQLLDRNNSSDTEEIEIILQYIHNTGENVKVRGIYRIQRQMEDFNLNATKIHNRQLLWHGTSSANMISILHQGIKIAPLNSQISGHLFGKGIYLADIFAKSQKYCRSTDVNGKTRKFILLCEAALGKIYDVKLDEACDKPMPSNFNSLKTLDSRYEPDPEATIIWKGRTVALGKTKEKLAKNNDEYWGLDYNEYIIFDTNQVAMRYLIEFED
ncbi:unnamed protein product [Orchesella dallaii]|uniref:Poly [ADP-ribose] polymerase n=1 Tax=Orchesella dallaii TaxID=48710 RepID=A0ABP1S9P7_9HEXA